MSLQTGPMARARIRIGPNAIQMSNDTVLHMLNLSDQLIEASIRQGRIYLQLGQLGPGESVELEIPRGSLWLLQAGSYDIEAGNAQQPTRIVVFDGKARFVGGQADVAIGAGEEAQVAGTYPAVTTSVHAPAVAAPAGSTAAATPPPPVASGGRVEPDRSLNSGELVPGGSPAAPLRARSRRRRRSARRSRRGRPAIQPLSGAAGVGRAWCFRRAIRRFFILGAAVEQQRRQLPASAIGPLRLSRDHRV